MSSELPQVRLKIARRSSHPWIFQKMVEKPAQRLAPGSVVDIVDRDGQWSGRGFYNGHSRITLRVLTQDQNEAIDDAYFARRLERAVGLRRQGFGLDAVTDAYRLVHSEGDGLSGLVVDRFGSTVVLTYRELCRFEPFDRPVDRLLYQLKRDGHDVAGAAAQYNLLLSVTETMYWQLDALRTLFEKLERMGINVRLA